ncbi:MAG: M17 family peptidase N-terminal domain-containing protein [Acidimicrobiales bacterium]
MWSPVRPDGRAGHRPGQHGKLVDGRSRATPAMVAEVERLTDEASTRVPPLSDFVVPGQERLAALLDLARTSVRRAERRAVPVAAPGSSVVPYLNRLSSLLWALARGEEATGGEACGPRTSEPPAPATNGRVPLMVELNAGGRPTSTVLAVPVLQDGGVPDGSGATLDEAFPAARRFTGKVGDLLTVPADDGGVVLAVGVGPMDEVDAAVLRRVAALAVRQAGSAEALDLALLAAAPAGLDRQAAAQAVAEGAALGTYAFSALARDLANEPPATMAPIDLAAAAERVAAEAGLAVEVWDEERLAEERCGGLLGVSAGSAQPARLIRLAYEPEGATTTVYLVGKGITFDSGGLSIKSAEGMITMKLDMSGAAAVIGTLSACPALGIGVRVVGLLCSAENMPGPAATRPGDVLRLRDGSTVEVLNTDAEGRLVLADGLALAAEARPDAIVDVATLTGSCVAALGCEVAGLFATDDELADRLEAAADASGEALWRLPLRARYRRNLGASTALSPIRSPLFRVCSKTAQICSTCSTCSEPGPPSPQHPSPRPPTPDGRHPLAPSAPNPRAPSAAPSAWRPLGARLRLGTPGGVGLAA